MSSPFVLEPFGWGGSPSFTPNPEAWKPSPQERMRKIRLLLLDVDGVLTDGRIIRMPDGQEALSFDVKDGAALVRLREAGFEVGLLSGRASPIVVQRADELGIRIRRLGVSDKLEAYQDILRAEGLSDAEVAYMGDDIADLPVMARAGLSAAPLDATEDVQQAADVVTTHFGGRGAVRDLCEMLIEARDYM